MNIHEVHAKEFCDVMMHRCNQGTN